MLKIIHLSDLHVGFEDMLDRFKHIVEKIIQTQTPPENYVIVITGDLVDGYDKYFQNYSNALEVINKLKDENFKVLIVPGNHDYQEELYSIYLRNKRKFINYFFGKNTADDQDTEFEYYPKCDIIDFQHNGNNEKIAFIGLDSSEDVFGTILNPRWERGAKQLPWASIEERHGCMARGKIGENQIRRFKDCFERKEINECKYRVVLLHHHPFEYDNFTNYLKDSREFKKALNYLHERNKIIDAILFGHNHHGDDYGINCGIPRCYDGGSSTRKGDGPSKSFVHRIIDLSQTPNMDIDGKFLDGWIFNR